MPVKVGLRGVRGDQALGGQRGEDALVTGLGVDAQDGLVVGVDDPDCARAGRDTAGQRAHQLERNIWPYGDQRPRRGESEWPSSVKPTPQELLLVPRRNSIFVALTSPVFASNAVSAPWLPQPAWFADFAADCVDAALTGRWRGALA